MERNWEFETNLLFSSSAAEATNCHSHCCQSSNGDSHKYFTCFTGCSWKGYSTESGRRKYNGLMINAAINPLRSHHRSLLRTFKFRSCHSSVKRNNNYFQFDASEIMSFNFSSIHDFRTINEIFHRNRSEMSGFQETYIISFYGTSTRRQA